MCIQCRENRFKPASPASPMNFAKALSISLVAILILPGCIQPESTEEEVEPMDENQNQDLQDNSDGPSSEPVTDPQDSEEMGCTRPDAINFDREAELLDDSCVFRLTRGQAMVASGGVLASMASFSVGNGILSPFDIFGENSTIHASQMEGGGSFLKIFTQFGSIRLFDMEDYHVLCLQAADQTTPGQDTEECWSGNPLSEGANPLVSALEVHLITMDSSWDPARSHISELLALFNAISDSSPLVWEEPLGATLDNQIFQTSTDSQPPLNIELSVNPSSSRMNHLIVEFENHSYSVFPGADYGEGPLPDSRRMPMFVQWDSRIGNTSPIVECRQASFPDDFHFTELARGPVFIDYGDPIPTSSEVNETECDLAQAEMLVDLPLSHFGDSISIWFDYFNPENVSSIRMMHEDEEGSGYGTVFQGITYYTREDCHDMGGSADNDYSQAVTWDSTYSICMFDQGEWEISSYELCINQNWGPMECISLHDSVFSQTNNLGAIFSLSSDSNTVFLCPDGTEVMGSDLGDLLADCPPVSEGGLPADEPFSFICSNGTLVLQGWVNDGWPDCPYGSDEGVVGHPDRSPAPPIFLWDCWYPATPGQLKSSSKPTGAEYASAMNSSTEPEWCGTQGDPEAMEEYYLQSNDSSEAALAGLYWVHYSFDGFSYSMATDLLDNGTFLQGLDFVTEDDCEEWGGDWSSELEVCWFDGGLWKADDEFFELGGYGANRYSLQEDLLWTGVLVHEDEFSGGPPPPPIWACLNSYYNLYEVYMESPNSPPSDEELEEAQNQTPPTWCESAVDNSEIADFSSDSASESELSGDYWFLEPDEGRAWGLSLGSDGQVREKIAESSVDECSEYGGTYDPINQVCTLQMGMTWSASDTLIEVEYDDGEFSFVHHIRYELVEDSGEVYLWNAFPEMPMEAETPPMENTFEQGYDEVPYHSYEFTAAEDGLHIIQSHQDNDGYLYLYQAPFEPDSPLEGVISSQDDWGDGSEIHWNLTKGFDYVIVTTLFDDYEPEMGFENVIWEPSGNSTSWENSLGPTSPEFIRPEGWWEEPPTTGPQFYCLDSASSIPMIRFGDGYADCLDGSDEENMGLDVDSGMVSFSDEGLLDDLEIRISDHDMGLHTTLHFEDAESISDPNSGSLTFTWPNYNQECTCSFTFGDADSDGRISEGDWWTLWSWRGFTGGESIAFYDRIAEEYINDGNNYSDEWVPSDGSENSPSDDEDFDETDETDDSDDGEPSGGSGVTDADTSDDGANGTSGASRKNTWSHSNFTTRWTIPKSISNLHQGIIPTTFSP